MGAVVLSDLEKKLPHEAAVLKAANFPNKTLVIVGATGGIGSAAAEIAHSLVIGHLIITYNLNFAKATEVSGPTGGVVHHYTHGVDGSATKFVDELPDNIDYVLDASGLPGHATLARLKKEPEAVVESFNANALGPFYLFVELLNSSKLNRGAQLAYLSTIAVDGNPSQAIYAAPKAAMGAAINCWVLEPQVIAKGVGLKSLELPVVRTENPHVKLFSRQLATAERALPGVTARLEELDYIMSPAAAAYRSLAAMADTGKTGIVRIPEGASVSSLQQIMSGNETPAERLARVAADRY